MFRRDLLISFRLRSEPFGGSANQIRKNAPDENKNKHISYNINTVFNSKDYLVRRSDILFIFRFWSDAIKTHRHRCDECWFVFSSISVGPNSRHRSGVSGMGVRIFRRDLWTWRTLWVSFFRHIVLDSERENESILRCRACVFFQSVVNHLGSKNNPIFEISIFPDRKVNIVGIFWRGQHLKRRVVKALKKKWKKI